MTTSSISQSCQNLLGLVHILHTDFVVSINSTDKLQIPPNPNCSHIFVALCCFILSLCCTSALGSSESHSCDRFFNHTLILSPGGNRVKIQAIVFQSATKNKIRNKKNQVNLQRNSNRYDTLLNTLHSSRRIA